MNKLTPALLLTLVRALSPGAANAADAATSDDTQGDTQTVTTVTVAPPEEPSDVHLSRAGLGSLYWAARHPGEAWRVVMPIDVGGVAFADLRARCALVSDAPSVRTVCP